MSNISTSQDVPVSILIPLYNEQNILEENLEALSKFLDRMVGSRNWLFLFVENGSTDATPDMIRAAIERWPMSQSVHFPIPNYGAALKTGLKAATTDWVYILDI